MNNKKIQIRAQQKHDIEANWNNTPNFIPLNGEIIIYDEDENNPTARVKIGDGETTINNLPFTFLPLNTEVPSAKVENETLILGKTQYIDINNTYTNILPTLVDTDGTIYDGKGYKQGYRISTSASTPIITASNMTVSGCIYCNVGDILKIYNAVASSTTANYIASFDSEGKIVKTVAIATFPVTKMIDEASFGDFSYIRFSCETISDNTLVILNENKDNYLVPNLYDSSKPGFTPWNGHDLFSNWIPYNGADNNNTGTIYHIKNWIASNSPYKFYFALDTQGTSKTPAIYAYNASIQPLTVSDYDNSVKIIQHHTTDYKFIQFEFREDVTYNDIIITANHHIIK